MHLQETDAGPSRTKPSPEVGAGDANTPLGGRTREEEAAVMIQKHYRGHRSRQQHSQVHL